MQQNVGFYGGPAYKQLLGTRVSERELTPAPVLDVEGHGGGQLCHEVTAAGTACLPGHLGPLLSRGRGGLSGGPGSPGFPRGGAVSLCQGAQGRNGLAPPRARSGAAFGPVTLSKAALEAAVCK